MPLAFDRDRTRDLLQRGIAAMQQISIDSKDLPARAANIFAQLLGSSRVFIHPDSPPGQPQPVPLRIRSRLAMSHVLDAWVWWREEFGGYAGVYPTPVKELQTPTPTANRGQSQQKAVSMPGQVDGTAMNGPPDALPCNLLQTQPSGYLNASYPSDPPMYPMTMEGGEGWPQDDVFANIWTWPDEDWGIPGLG